MAANRELIEMEKIQPGPAGLLKLSVKEEVFTAHKAEDIEALIKTTFSTSPFPVGNTMNQEASPVGQTNAFWSWGYFKRSKEHDTYKKAVADQANALMFMSEKYQQLGTAKYYEGAMLDAKQSFEIHKNNYDIFLYVKFTSIKIDGM